MGGNVLGGSGKDVHGYGLVGGIWQKQPISIGWSERFSESLVGTQTGGAGDLIVASTPVPVGEVHVVEYCTYYHDDPTNKNVSVYLHDGTNAHQVGYHASLAAATLRNLDHIFTLGPGDHFEFIVWAIADTKHGHGALWGRRIDIDQ